jgi:hypothetical protein
VENSKVNERWQQLQEVFDAAIALPFDEREQYLLEKCGCDETLLRDVLSLIENFHLSSGLLDRDAFEFGLSVMASQIESPKITSSLGAYRADYYPHLSKFMQHNYLRKRQRNTRQSLSDGATTVRVFDHKDVGNSQAYRVLGVLGSGGMGDVFLLTIHVWIGK